MKILAIIPARSGSKGLPHKNIAKIGDVTLLELAVQVALRCPLISDVYISTDSAEYEQIGLNAGANSLGLRPAELASDTAKTTDVVLDILEKLNKDYDYIVLLQPTSPLRTPQDIMNMVTAIEQSNAEAAVSVTLLEEPHPYKLKAIDENGYITPFIEGTTSEVPRQTLPAAYALNGALYVVEYKTFLEKRTFLPQRTLPYIMKDNINIDTEADLARLTSMHHNPKS
jgi:CMP-N,N'-diacetyllegionaminic acid synthase